MDFPSPKDKSYGQDIAAKDRNYFSELQELLIRPITEADLDFICTVAAKAGYGFTSLPNDRNFHASRVKRAVQSFAAAMEHKAKQIQANESSSQTPFQGLYLFIMETVTKQFAGICGIKAGVGIAAPFYNFRIDTFTQASLQLNKTITHKTLTVVDEFKGAAELISLYVNNEFRGKRRAEFLSRARLMFIAEFNGLFSTDIISEIRGVSDNNGMSPFWHGIGKNFFAMDFAEADYLTGTTNKQFITELMPKHPIYVDLLPTEVIEVMGKTHVHSAPAKHILVNEGLEYSKYIDVFDGGPLLAGEKEKIRTIAQSKQSIVVQIVENIAGGIQVMLCPSAQDNQHKEDGVCANAIFSMDSFKIKIALIKLVATGEIVVDQATAQTLQLKIGGTVRWCEF